VVVGEAFEVRHLIVAGLMTGAYSDPDRRLRGRANWLTGL
jgi:hypothetical protein